MKKEDRLFIIGLEVENFKRINLVKIVPNDTGLTVIGGDNMQGKSSLLDATMAALAGAKSLPDRPLRDGAKEGHAIVDLSNGLVVERTFNKTKKGGDLVVKTKDGHTIDSAQTALDDPFGGIGFDPVKFINVNTPKEKRKQMQMLLDALGLDFADLDIQKDKTFKDRTVVNQEVNRLEGAISATAYHEDALEKEVSLSALTGDFEEANAANTQMRAKIRNLTGWHDTIARLKAKIDELEKEMAEARTEADNLQTELVGIEERDVGKIREKMSTVEEDNKKVRSNNDRSRLEADLKNQKRASAVLTGELQGIEDEKRKMIEEADIPIKGLDFGAEGLLYKELPLAQAASSEKLAVAIALADVLSPKSRVVLIREGSNLDPNSLRKIAELSNEKGLQVIMERVSKGPEVDIVIEDGHVDKS